MKEEKDIQQTTQADNDGRVGALVELPNVLYQKEPNSIWYSNVILECSNCRGKVGKVTSIKLNEQSDESLFCDKCQPAAIKMAFALNPKLEFIFLRSIEYEQNPLQKAKENKKKKRGPIGLSLRFKVMQRDKYRCVICGNDATKSKLEIDHIVPVAAGGKTIYENLQTLCFECNRGKRSEFM